ncbi:MAG TPA: hypothetical protein VN397_02365 [Candidatus Methylomirabilis sp.]|nr:hypothetical protein [Candidatus Methylomirabilis sp.]
MKSERTTISIVVVTVFIMAGIVAWSRLAPTNTDPTPAPIRPADGSVVPASDRVGARTLTICETCQGNVDGSLRIGVGNVRENGASLAFLLTTASGAKTAREFVRTGGLFTFEGYEVTVTRVREGGALNKLFGLFGRTGGAGGSITLTVVPPADNSRTVETDTRDSSSAAAAYRDACGDSDVRAAYYFGDSSVPPQYHRSYAIVVRDNAVRLLVESYGDVKTDETRNVDAKKLADALSDTKALNAIAPDAVPDGCTGGRMHGACALASDGTRHAVDFYACGEVNREQTVSLDAWGTKLRALIPDFEGKMKRE